MGCGSSQDARPMTSVVTAASVPIGDKGEPKQRPSTSSSPAAPPATPTAGAVASGPPAGATLTVASASASSSASPAPAATSSTPVSAPAPPVRPARLGPPIPVSVLTDSYKASHYLMYPDARLMVAYGEFRGAFNKDPEDSRFVFTGIRYIIETFIAVPWTEEDVEQASLFYSTHNAGFQPFPFPKDLFLKFVRENRGYFPVRIEALREGTVANIHVPVYQIFAEAEYARLITFLETILTQVWYPSTVATLSRRTRDLIERGFAETADDADAWQVDYKLHDFGMRGCTSIEQSVLGGCAHLLNFGGSDTMSASYYAQFHLNEGRPVASSIPATEHSVMTSWPNERLAMENMIDKFGGENAVFSVVMDSYDYSTALTKVLPAVAERHKQKGGTIVLRPDSGDPVTCIIAALEAGERNFPTTTNSKGYKVIRGLAAIQGDGINYKTVEEILVATKEAGFSAQNVAFGMGGGLLQKVNRDTMSFATKLSFIVYADGTEREVMKRPKTESNKFSLPGIVKVRRDEEGKLWVEPREPNEPADYSTNELQLVYDHGPVAGAFDSFDVVRARVKEQWAKTPKLHDVVGPAMKERIARWVLNFDANYERMINDINSDAAKVQPQQQTATTTEEKPVKETVAEAEAQVAAEAQAAVEAAQPKAEAVEVQAAEVPAAVEAEVQAAEAPAAEAEVQVAEVAAAEVQPAETQPQAVEA